MIENVKFVSIAVSDQDRALQFYSETLGFRVHTDQPMGGGARWIELRIGKSDTRFVLFKADGEEFKVGSGFHGALGCDDVEATVRQLQSRGVEFETPYTPADWGGYAVMKDIDGNTFVLSAC